MLSIGVVIGVLQCVETLHLRIGNVLRTGMITKTYRRDADALLSSCRVDGEQVVVVVVVVVVGKVVRSVGGPAGGVNPYPATSQLEPAIIPPSYGLGRKLRLA